MIFTTLHAGGKFDNDAYKVAGGLHGVGASVVNALSKSLVAQVRRDGLTYTQRYRRGKPLGPVEPGEPARGTGTTVTFTPDPEIFRDAAYDPKLIAERLEVKTYLNKGLVIQFVDQKEKTSLEFRHEGGVADFLDAVNQVRGDTRVAALPFVLEREDSGEGLRCHVALAWTESTEEVIRSFVNTIPTPDGGTHEQGLREAVRAAVRRSMTDHDLIKKGIEVKNEDIFEGLTAVLSVCVHEPQFQGQTKGRLNNPEVRSLVESMVRPRLENFLIKNKSVADAIAARVIQAAKAREASRAAASQVRRKTAISNRLNLPGKLHDCDSTNPEESELFIVEGDSAGGSAKQGARPRHPGHPAAQGQGPQRRAGGQGQGARQQGADRHHQRPRLRHGRPLRPRAAPLRQDHPLDRRRQRWPSHRHPPADLLLPPRPRPPERRPRLPRLPAPLQDRLGQGDPLGGRRRDPRPDPGQAAQERQAEHHPLQGPGRDARPVALRDHPRPARRRLLRVVIPDGDRVYTERTVTDLMGKEPEARFKFIMTEAYTAKDIDI